MENEKQRNLSEISRDISDMLLESFRLLEILEELIAGEAKEDLLISIVKNNVESAFKDIEKCREMISVAD